MAKDTNLELAHLRRDIRSALELAVAGLAPETLIDRLATNAGLFEALLELPDGSPPVLALTPRLVERSKSALEEWARWEKAHLARL